MSVNERRRGMQTESRTAVFHLDGDLRETRNEDGDLHMSEKWSQERERGFTHGTRNEEEDLFEARHKN
jgi:hypothetical protein